MSGAPHDRPFEGPPSQQASLPCSLTVGLTVALTVGLPVALVVPQAAHADPVALRAPTDEALVVTAGWPNLGVGWWLQPQVGIGVHFRGPAAGVDLSVAGRWRLVGPEAGDDGWRLDAQLTGGFTVGLQSGSFATHVIGTLSGGLQREGFSGGLAVSPHLLTGMARTAETRLALMVEPWLGVRIGEVRVLAQLGVGPVFSEPGERGTLDAQGSVHVAVPLD